jgi:hypothetical protein
MTSEVKISNLAIAALGHKSFIQSMTEESVEARYANLFYENTRRSTLRAHPWNFATGRKVLALLGDGKGKWTYMYALPNNCLKARFIEPVVPSDKVPFEVALSDDGNSKIIYCNVPEAELIYTVDVKNPDLFDPMFEDTFALNLSQRMCPVIAPNKSQEILTKYVNSLRAAEAADASEGEPEDVQQTDWLEARVSGSTTYVREVT